MINFSELDKPLCESCGSANCQQLGVRTAPFPGDGVETLVTDYQCLDCGDHWNVWN